MAFREPLYERYSSTFKGAQDAPSQAWWEHKYLPLLADLPRDAPILEIGCGAGELLSYLGSQGFSNAKGVDISAEQVMLAQRHGVRAEVGDAFDVRGTYALIIAVDVLEHFTRDELLRLMPVLFGALQPGGRLLIQTANGAGLFPGQVIFGDLTHMTVLTPESLAQLLRQAGFGELAFYETGPIPLRLRGRLNVTLWAITKLVAQAIRYVETGKRQRIWTENFICLARKPAHQARH